MQDEGLDAEAVDIRVDGAGEGPHLASRDPLDGLDELPHGRVLEEQPRLAQPLVLGHLEQGGLRRRGAVLEHDAEDVTGPRRAGGRRATPELVFEQAHHLVRERHQHPAAAVTVNPFACLLLRHGYRQSFPESEPTSRAMQIAAWVWKTRSSIRTRSSAPCLVSRFRSASPCGNG